MVQLLIRNRARTRHRATTRCAAAALALVLGLAVLLAGGVAAASARGAAAATVPGPSLDPVDPGRRATALAGPAVGFSLPAYSVSEAESSAAVTVTLSAPYSRTVTVDCATADGTAVAGRDYVTASGTLRFTPGVTTASFAVSIMGDTVAEANETVSLTLDRPISGTLGALRVATLTILNDDPYLAFLPLVVRNQGSAAVCPGSSQHAYSGGTAFQFDQDDPVRPAYAHADKDLALRGYTPNTDAGLQRELVDYGSDDAIQPPQLATLFAPFRVPAFGTFYRVHHWAWAPSPDPGARGDPITTWPVTALGMRTTPGETLHVPRSGYEIAPGDALEAIVLFADADTVALRYTREDSSGSAGYTVHVDRICTDPNLLALYNTLDDPDGPRYVYRPPDQRPYTYDLPALAAGQALGVARGSEIVVAIVDTGGFMDTRSCDEWWQVRPGYAGSCPPHE